MYVMKPLSYSPCAHLMVSLADKRSFLFASCCNVLVVNGGKMGFAMELILTPIIHKMIEEKNK